MEKKNGKYTLFTVMLMPASITKILFRILFYIISNTVIASFTEISLKYCDLILKLYRSALLAAHNLLHSPSYQEHAQLNTC